MVAKSQIKRIVRLKQKKYRNQEGLFVVEGAKLVAEVLQAGLLPCWLFAEETQSVPTFQAVVVSSSEMKQMSSLSTPSGVLGVFYKPQPRVVTFTDWVVALDTVRDPGNLGTLIRLCDWFGIQHLLCSEDTVDCYNPKVVQATMGSIARVNVVYSNLCAYLKGVSVPVYGACVEGVGIYGQELPKQGVLVLGNEARGISEAVAALVTQRIAIPSFGGRTAESLNVATAGAILLSELRR